MLWYCLKSKKKTESKNPKVLKTKNRIIMLLSKCAVCGSEKSRFIKEQETSGSLRSSRTKTVLIKIPLVSPFLFFGASAS